MKTVKTPGILDSLFHGLMLTAFTIAGLIGIHTTITDKTFRDSLLDTLLIGVDPLFNEYLVLVVALGAFMFYLQRFENGLAEFVSSYAKWLLGLTIFKWTCVYGEVSIFILENHMTPSDTLLAMLYPLIASTKFLIYFEPLIFYVFWIITIVYVLDAVVNLYKGLVLEKRITK